MSLATETKRPKLKIKLGATVEVIAGADKGKKGSVIELNSRTMKIKVQGVRVQTHYDRKDGLLKKEGFVDYSNVKLVEQAKEKTKTAPKKKTAAKK